MEKYLNPIAERDSPDSGKFATPKDVYPIRKEFNFYCPDHNCLDPERKLFPAKSKLGNYFFKHNNNYGHDIRPETLLHKLSIKWFKGKGKFEIPSFQVENKVTNQQLVSIDSELTELEYRRLERIIPDVKLTTNNGFQFAIEIVVTSDLSEEKIKLIEQFNLPTIRIDLTKFYEENTDKCRVDYDFVTAKLDELLSDIRLKSWAVLPKYSETKGKLELTGKPKTDNTGCLIGLVSVGLIYLFNKLKK